MCELLENSSADFNMGPLDIVVHRFAYVVEQRRFLGHIDIRFNSAASIPAM